MIAAAAAAAAGVASLAPASSALLRPRSASRLLLLLRPRRPPPLLHWAPPPPPPSSHLFCSKILAPADTDTGDGAAQDAAGERVREFRRRLRIADVKGGPDEGLDRLGQKLSVRGWVRTCRIQSSVTFIEVNDGSCLSNMQCVMSSDAEGYDQTSSYSNRSAEPNKQGTLSGMMLMP